MRKTSCSESWIQVFDVTSSFGHSVLKEDSKYVVIQIEVANPQTRFTGCSDAVVMAELITKEDYNKITTED